MNFRDLEQAALQLNDLYEQLEVKRWGRVWTTQELALGFDVPPPSVAVGFRVRG